MDLLKVHVGSPSNVGTRVELAVLEGMLDLLLQRKVIVATAECEI